MFATGDFILTTQFEQALLKYFPSHSMRDNECH